MISDILSDKPRSRSPPSLPAHAPAAGLNLSLSPASHERRLSSHTDSSLSSPGADSLLHPGEKRKHPEDEDDVSDLDVEDSDCEDGMNKSKFVMDSCKILYAHVLRLLT